MFRWPWSKKKKKADKSQEVERGVMCNALTLTMVDGKRHIWTVDKWKGNNYLVPWIKFYHWYFEKDSLCYVMKYDEGETMIKRADIKSFTVNLTKVKS